MVRFLVRGLTLMLIGLAVRSRAVPKWPRRRARDHGPAPSLVGPAGLPFG